MSDSTENEYQLSKMPVDDYKVKTYISSESQTTDEPESPSKTKRRKDIPSMEPENAKEFNAKRFTDWDIANTSLAAEFKTNVQVEERRPWPMECSAEYLPDKNGVGIFWDIQSCPVPKGKSVLQVIENIRRRFITHDYREHFFVCIIDERKESDLTISDFRKAGVQIHKKSIGIEQKMKYFASNHSALSRLVFIGDISAGYFEFQKKNEDREVILVHSSMVKTVLFTELIDGLSAGDRNVATDESSEVKNLTSRLKESWSFLVTLTGNKLQIERTTPEGWITLNLIITSDIPVDNANTNSQYPTISSSGASEADDVMRKALTCILLMKSYMKKLFSKVKTKSQEENPKECVKTMFDDFQRISAQIITMQAMLTKDFLFSYKVLVNTLEKITASLKSGKCSAPFSDDLFTTTEEELLCENLGVLPNLAQSLQCLDEDDKNHQPVSYYIEKWFINCFYGRPNISKEFPSNVTGIDLEKALVAMDFSDEAASAIVSSIDIDFHGTQTLMYWALKNTNHMLSSHIMLKKDAYDPYQPDRVNEWFKEDIVRPSKCEPRINQTLRKSIFMINVKDTEEKLTFKEEDIIKQCQPGTELWYHGTNTYDAAHSILTEGIQLKEGRSRQDFSDTNGFYVSNNFKAAKKFAQRCSTYGYAVVVFKMNIESSDWIVLDLANDNVTWRKVVRYHRLGVEMERVDIPDDFDAKCDEPVMETIEVDELDCIKGYICSDPHKLDESELPVIKIDHVPIQQVCVKTPVLAKNFGSLGNICAIIWFP